MQQQCLGTTKVGERCKSWAMPGSDFCLAHDPSRIADLAEYRRQGGKGKSHEARARKAAGSFKDLNIAQTTMVRVIKKLEEGQIEPAIATAMATCVRALDAVTKSAALAELEQEIVTTNAYVAKIEAMLKERPA